MCADVVLLKPWAHDRRMRLLSGFRRFDTFSSARAGELLGSPVCCAVYATDLTAG